MARVQASPSPQCDTPPEQWRRDGAALGLSSRISVSLRSREVDDDPAFRCPVREVAGYESGGGRESRAARCSRGVKRRERATSAILKYLLFIYANSHINYNLSKR
jgi:hypothetical protein